jgi:hypothetical protein
MSDTSQGPNWWLGVDGKWYPPVARAPEPPANTSPDETVAAEEESKSPDQDSTDIGPDGPVSANSPAEASVGPGARNPVTNRALGLIAVLAIGVLGLIIYSFASSGSSSSAKKVASTSTIYRTTTTVRATTTTKALTTADQIGKTCAASQAELPKDTARAATNSNLGARCVDGKWMWIAEAGSPTNMDWSSAISPDGIALKAEYVPRGQTVWKPADQPRTAITGGTRKVGFGPDELKPGTYEALNVRDCYWERRDGNGNISANNFGSAARMEFSTWAGESVTINSAGSGSSCEFVRIR